MRITTPARQSNPGADLYYVESEAHPGDKTEQHIVEAVQLTWNNWDEICRFVPKPWFVRGCYLDKQGRESSEETDTMGLIIKTLESNEFIATENDFIIKGVNGEFYACKPDIFRKTYIAVLAPSKTVRQIAAEENDSEHGPAVEGHVTPVVTDWKSTPGGQEGA